MGTNTLIFWEAVAVGFLIGAVGFLIGFVARDFIRVIAAACLRVGDRDEDNPARYGPADWDISQMPDGWSNTAPTEKSIYDMKRNYQRILCQPEKTLLKNVRAKDTGVEE